MSARKKNKRNKILLILIFIIAAIVVGYLYYHQKYGKFSIKTDNAYIKQDILYLSPKVSGTIDKVYIHAPQKISKGELVAHIDDTDYKLAFEGAKEALVQSVMAFKRLSLQAKEAKVNIELSQILLQKAQKDFKREQNLHDQKAVSDDIFEKSKIGYDKANQGLILAKQRYQTIKAMLGNADAEQNPQIKAAITNLKKAYLALKRCNIVSPIDGVVAKKSFTIGSLVSPRSTLAAIVPQSGFWVDANFKEPKIKNIKIGQSVKLYSDLYGKDVVYHGKVEGISAGTGAVFSLLPPQNATGNWIKIVQRIPIRISLDQKELQKHPLHVGSSMTAIVDISDQKAQKLSKIETKPKADSNENEEKYIDYIDKLAKKIIKENL